MSGSNDSETPQWQCPRTYGTRMETSQFLVVVFFEVCTPRLPFPPLFLGL